MKSKEKDVSFIENEHWLNDLAFLVDITKYLAELNVKLQGKEQYVMSTNCMNMCKHPFRKMK